MQGADASFLLLIIPADSYMFQQSRASGELFLPIVYKECVHTHISAYAHTRCPANKRGCKQAGRGEIDAALSPAKRHATSLMHMTHVGREKG